LAAYQPLEASRERYIGNQMVIDPPSDLTPCPCHGGEGLVLRWSALGGGPVLGTIDYDVFLVANVAD
jgi:hypothetical protein